MSGADVKDVEVSEAVLIRFKNQSESEDESSWFTLNHARILSNLSILLRLPAVSTPHNENSPSTSTKASEEGEDKKPALLLEGQSTFLTHLSGART